MGKKSKVSLLHLPTNNSSSSSSDGGSSKKKARVFGANETSASNFAFHSDSDSDWAMVGMVNGAAALEGDSRHEDMKKSINADKLPY